MAAVTIGGMPLVVLTAKGRVSGPRLISAVIVPGRALMLLQLKAELPGRGIVDLISAPPLPEAAQRLNDQSQRFPGNAAFAFGGAVLAPFANRVRGTKDGDDVVVNLGQGQARLPANGGGRPAGAERYAIHGLILDQPVADLRADAGQAEGSVTFGGGRAWPSRMAIHIFWRLTAQRLRLEVTGRNIGDQLAPLGLGWHPYFNLPSGRREQARLHIPSTTRAMVEDYQSVLPTGFSANEIGSAHDFSGPEGRALEEMFLDDCYLDLRRNADNEVEARITDPLADLSLRVASRSPHVQAMQVYAPPKEPFVVVEPQFNLADPFGAVWGGRDTGMVWLMPNQAVTYDARIEFSDERS